MTNASDDSRRRLPLRGAVRTHQQIVIAHHLILHGYGHWLPNDPRGSGSEEIRDAKFEPLGPIHHGRKRIQPSRDELRDFHRRAEPLLNFKKLWFDEAKRQAIGESFGALIAKAGNTVWGCAVLKNHAHLCVRRHRHDAGRLWQAFADGARLALLNCSDIAADHPVWSVRPYKVFLYTPQDVVRIVGYIAENPDKEGLPEQSWPFVKPYDGWPHKQQTTGISRPYPLT